MRIVHGVLSLMNDVLHFLTVYCYIHVMEHLQDKLLPVITYVIPDGNGHSLNNLSCILS